MASILSSLGNVSSLPTIVDPLVKQTKSVLRIYREVKWAMEERQGELYDHLAGAGWGNFDTGTIYLTTFAPDIDMREFEIRVSKLVEDGVILNFIDRAIHSLKQYPEHGAGYHQIVHLQYLSHRKLAEVAILAKLCMERSTFYRRKREALFLLGLCLFGLLPKEHEPEQLTLFPAC